MPTNPSDMDYHSHQIDMRITLSPKERRVLEFIRDNNRCLTSEIKMMLREEKWERYEEEKSGEVARWPHTELAKKGLIHPHSQGTAKYWEVTDFGKQFVGENGPNPLVSNNYQTATEKLALFPSLTELQKGMCLMARIFLRSHDDNELNSKITKLQDEYAMPESVVEILRNARRTNEGEFVRIAA